MAFSAHSKWTVILISALAAIAIVVLLLHAIFAHSTAGEDSRNRWFVCAATGRPFMAHLEVGATIPVLSPFSHKQTGYPAELCYWNADGSVKLQPTPVLLKRFLDPSDTAPTFCPDCGRLVVAHNPPPVAGHAPPTRDQWMPSHSDAANPSRQ